MIQGTSSNAGKTTIVAGLCRLFARQGLKVTPFKAQNMALNSYVTESGGEIARAIAVQAAAARQEPHVHMNPILLKPKADDTAQLIVHGRAIADVSAKAYFLSDEFQDVKQKAIEESIQYLKSRYDLIIAEGAGSCAEPNLRQRDVVNMGVAHMLGADVIVVTDIDKGGVFADMLGTLRVMELTAPEDLALLKGFLINKFRGDYAVLKPGIEFIERHTHRPVVGVLPFLHGLDLEEEDRVREQRCASPDIDIAIIYLPHISNANDFDFLSAEENVQLRFIKSADTLGMPDAIIIPGTKNTSWDLDYLRRIGLAQAIKQHALSTPVIGICGGYQMLGKRLVDEAHMESELGTMEGLGLLDFEVEFLREKTVTKRQYTPTQANVFRSVGPLSGYEIHTGIVHYGNCSPMFTYPGGQDGAIEAGRLVFGTFIHDLFANAEFTRAFINLLRAKKRLPPLQNPLPVVRDRADEHYDTLALSIAEHIHLPIELHAQMWKLRKTKEDLA
jgi:adenosylcobyric acid synthase